jgi:hypothetical protein
MSLTYGSLTALTVYVMSALIFFQSNKNSEQLRFSSKPEMEPFYS